MHLVLGVRSFYAQDWLGHLFGNQVYFGNFPTKHKIYADKLREFADEVEDGVHYVNPIWREITKV